MQKRFLWLLLTLLCLTGVATIAGAAPSQQEAPPAVFETMPFEGEELLLSQPVTLYFNQPMDRASVEAGLTIEPDMNVEFAWEDDQTLIITPTQEWERGQFIEINIGTAATSASGTAFEEEAELLFQTVGFLEVTEVLPNDNTRSVDTDAPITVIFNRPVVPLVSLEEQADLPDPLELDPPVEGTGEWLNTSIYIFRPETGLPGGSTITATIPAGLTDATGAVLAEDVSWSFSTLLPEITEIRPVNSVVPLDRAITVYFSQPMNTETTEQAITVADETGTPVAGTFEWNDANTVATFTPTELLELDTFYTTTVNAEIATSATGAALARMEQVSFSTVEYPRIISTEPDDGDRDAPPYGGITVYFSAPIDEATLTDKFVIEPEPWRDFNSYYYDYDYRYSLYFDTEPSTDYTVTILPGIKDPYGNEITTTTVINYRTAPYTPEIALNAPDFIGLYSAYNPNTRIFATHRNVSRLDLELYQLDLNTLQEFLGPNGYDFRYNWNPGPNELIREWSLNVQSQQDRRRYELLLLSASGGSGIQNLQCLGAPNSQIMVGDVAQVSEDDPRPLRLRADPNTQATILTELPVGTQFNVIGGPICADGFIWWNIQVQESGQVGWSAEGTPDNYFMEMVERVASSPDVNPEDYPALEPGVYYLTMDAPEIPVSYDPIEHLALVATANITLKFSQDQVMAWVTDLQTGQPVPDAPVTFYDMNGRVLGRLNTNQDGVALLEIPKLDDLYTTIFASITRDGQFAFASSNFDQGIDPWRFSVPADYQPEDLNVYLYTDRPIYRPDQPVYFKGIVRNREDVTYSLPDDLRNIPVTVFDPEDQVVYEGSLPLTPYGTFAGQFMLDPEAALGYYRIIANVSSNIRTEFGLGFNVAEYSAPEFQVEALAVQPEVVQGATVEVEVESRYFFGGAVSNANVTWAVLAQDYFFSYEGEGYYDFVDYNYDSGPGEFYDGFGKLIAEGVGTTDAQGNFVVSVPGELSDQGQSQLYTIEATITDESDQSVSGRVEVVVHQGEVYVGLRPENYISRAGQETLVNVITVDWDSQPVPEQVIDYRVVERRWASVQEEDELGRTVWTWEVEELPVEGAEGTVVSDAEGQAQITFTPPLGGTYKVYATSRDSLGNEITSSTFMWVAGENYVAWRQQNSNTFDLITDKDEYSVGDTAEILIASPFQGQTNALITVERAGIISQEVIRMETNSTVYRLPITLDYAPNIFISVVLVKGVDEFNPYAEFRMGMAQLIVDTEQLAMNIEITPSIDVAGGAFAGPGDEITYTVKTTDWEGNPVSAEVGLSVTDLSVLSIAPPNSEPLMNHFYFQRGVSVRTSTALTVSVDKATQTIIDTIKGGGGGGSEAGIFDIRQEFVDTPGWEPSLVTDENGMGTFTLTLPDNLTTWRLDARAITSGEDRPMLVGQTTFDLLSTKPLLLRALTPRFMVVGDLVEFGAIVNNNTGTTQAVELTLQGTGFELVEGVNLTQTVEIPAGSRQRVNWQARVLDVPSVDLTFFASGNDGAYTDATKPPLGLGDNQLLPVYKYEVPENVATAGNLYGPEQSTRSEIVSLPRRFDITQGELRIKVDRSLAAATLDGLEYLEHFPHHCTEQTISRFLPNIITVRALEQLNVSNPELRASLDAGVSFALQRLYSAQKPDGGWGWFPEYASNPLVTAYAIYALAQARDNGYTVDQNVINRAVRFVENEINGLRINIETPRWRLNRQAFLVFALTEAGEFQSSPASLLFDNRERMNLDARAFLALALAKMNPTDPRLDALMGDFSATAVLSATGAHWEDEYDFYNWTTDTRSTALVLRAMISIQPDNQLIPQGIRWLMVARTADAWETTQETAWAVLALTDWMVETGELQPDYTFSIGLNGQELPVEDNTATADNVKDTTELRIEVAELLADEMNRLTFVHSEGEGNLYYTAYLRIFLPVPEVEPVSKGIIIDRKYYLADDEERANPITSGMVGQEVEVVLTIIAPNALHYVIIEDPIPAGAAAVDPNLLTTSVLSGDTGFERVDNPRYGGWGWWYFSRREFRDEKVVMYADYLPAGTYEYHYTLRLGLAGEYNVIPPTGQEFYFPEVYGRGAGSLFVIEPEPTEPE